MEFLLKNNAVKSIVREDACPASAAIDAHARATFLDSKALERADQRKPALELASATCRDSAELAAIGDVELGHRRRAYCFAVPRKPQQRRAVAQVLHDPGNVGAIISLGRASNERRNQRPGLGDPRRIDADSLTLWLSNRQTPSSHLQLAISRRMNRGRYGRSGHCWHVSM
jgi:hypothetical protein